MTPIPVAEPFDPVGMDVILFPQSHGDDNYAVMVMDYLLKCSKFFAVPDQSDATIARLLVKDVVHRHDVPAEIWSERGRAFLSSLMEKVELLLGFHKVNHAACNPQTDGLIERFNFTLTTILAKGRDWYHHFLYVLFAYQASLQGLTQESPFFLLYV